MHNRTDQMDNNFYFGRCCCVKNVIFLWLFVRNRYFKVKALLLHR